MTTATISLPFTEDELDAAYAEWGCNCGPSALAFALQKPLDYVRTLIPDFERKRYTSPSMMKAGLAAARQPYTVMPPTGGMFHTDRFALVRVQFGGPWTAPGANPRWAYCHTHWFATAALSGEGCKVFDCNTGVMSGMLYVDRGAAWVARHSDKRADGTWRPTHVWVLEPTP